MKTTIDSNKIDNRRSILPLNGPNDIQKIRKLLEDQPRNLLIFDLAVETGLRITELLQLKVKDFKELAVGDKIVVTGSNNDEVVISKNIHETFQIYCNKLKPQHEDYIFKSRKGNQPLKINSVSEMIKGWFRALNLDYLAGAKSLRKTWEVYYNNQSVITGKVKKSEGLVVKPLKPITLQEMAYQELLKAIVSRKIEPGQTLVTEKLASEMQISNRPVREALARLAQSGIVAPQKRRGFVVVELSKESLIEILDIRIRLESMAGEAATISCSAETIDRLEAFYKQLVEGDHQADLKKIQRANKDFHFTLYEAANKPILLQMIRGLWDRWTPYFILVLENRYKYPKISEMNLAIHFDILESIRCHDPEMVAKAIEKDLTWVLKELIDTIEM